MGYRWFFGHSHTAARHHDRVFRASNAGRLRHLQRHRRAKLHQRLLGFARSGRTAPGRPAPERFDQNGRPCVCVWHVREQQLEACVACEVTLQSADIVADMFRVIQESKTIVAFPLLEVDFRMLWMACKLLIGRNRTAGAGITPACCSRRTRFAKKPNLEESPLKHYTFGSEIDLG